MAAERLGALAARAAPNPASNAPSPQAKYVVLARGELVVRQKEATSQVADLFCVSQAEAARVLRRYKW